jgi:hypothetical protein
MRRRSFGVIFGGALILATPAAWGATATFDVGAVCETDCGAAGLGPNDLVTGSIEVSTDGFAPSGPVARADLVGFEIFLGGSSSDIFKPLSPAYDFAATWGADARTLQSVSFVASGAVGLGAAGPFLSTSRGGNALSIWGVCGDALCTTPSFAEGPPASLTPVRFTPVSAAPVPLPATAPLIAAGALALAAAAGLRRRRLR